MKEIKEMNIEELKEEIKYIVSLMDDDEMFRHSSAYLAELTEELASRMWREA